MPTALDRFLTGPAAWQSFRALCSRPALSRRGYSSEPERPRPKQRQYIAEIDRESRVNDPDLLRSKCLKIDQVPVPKQAGLWAEVLLYRERVYGIDGICDILWGMARRGYSIPTNDTQDAEALWSTLLKHPRLVVPVVDYATHIYEKTGSIYPRLYEKCIAYWLPKDAIVALDYHHRMVVKLRLRKLPLRRLARLIKLGVSDKAIEAFMDIYRTSNERDIYDEIVPSLCDQGRITLARRWHTMCVHRGDLPSPDVASHPVVRLFTAETSLLTGPDVIELIASDQGTIAKHVHTAGNKKPKYNQELLRRLEGRDTAPVRFDDPFCARLFATKAFPPETIIQGLVMAGVNEIGPQAVRQMAQRTEPISELPHRFRELREAGIALQGSVFSLALEKFAKEGRFALVLSILHSDQHPDVFGDAKLQTELLDYYLEHADWTQAHRTLAILSLFHNDACIESWNLMLQAHIRKFYPGKIMEVLQDMRTHNILVSLESMTALRTILRSRQIGRKPSKSSRGRFDDLRFITRIYIMILESGIGQVYPFAWREIIRRFGMLGRVKELKRLLFWLLFWYAPRNDAAFANLPKSPFLDAATSKMRREYPESFQYFNVPRGTTQNHRSHPIRQLFPNSLQQALIVWSFRASLLPNASLEQSMLSTIPAKRYYRQKLLKGRVLERPDWKFGLRTLLEMRHYGVHVHEHTVVKALQQQFVNLFGRGRSNKLENRMMEDVNRIPYDVYVKEVNHIWGSELLPNLDVFTRSRLHHMSWHPRRPRIVNRKKWCSAGEILGLGRRNTVAEAKGETHRKDMASQPTTAESSISTPLQDEASISKSSDINTRHDGSTFPLPAYVQGQASNVETSSPRPLPRQASLLEKTTPKPALSAWDKLERACMEESRRRRS